MFISVDWKKIDNMNLRDLNRFIKTNFASLTCEDRYKIEIRQHDMVIRLNQFLDSFLKCEVMQLAYKQTCRQFPDVAVFTESQRASHPERFNAFIDSLFDNAEKILKYQNEQTKQRKRRACRKS